MPLIRARRSIVPVLTDDPLFPDVGLLLPLREDFNDRSLNGRSLSSSGVILSSNAAKFGAQSAKFENKSFLSFQNASNLGLSGDFCIEAWVCQAARPTEFAPILECLNGTGYSFALRNGRVNFYDFATDHTAQTVIPLNTWVHVAVWRKNGTLILWVNGVPDYGITNTRNITTSGNYRVGSNSWSLVPNFWFDGFIQDVRLTLAPRFLTVPTSPLPTS